MWYITLIGLFILSTINHSAAVTRSMSDNSKWRYFQSVFNQWMNVNEHNFTLSFKKKAPTCSVLLEAKCLQFPMVAFHL